jgi:predicted aldo/keto reductase-like oxidoreductase
MMSYNFLSPPEDREWLGKLHGAGLGIVPMKPLAGRFYEKTTRKPDALIRWLAADARVHTIPVGMYTVEQVEQNVGALHKPLSDEDRKDLKGLMAYNSLRFCRMCGACDGRCPYGLAVSDLVRVAMYAEGYRNPGLARTHLAAIPPSQRRISCQDCEQCSILCPNGVAIRDRILRAQELLA